MLKRILALLFLLGAGLSLYAADFWLKKKFSEWTPKEVQQMVRDSPWARPVSVRLDMGRGGAVTRAGGRGGRGGGGGGGGGRGPGSVDASMGSAGSGPADQMGGSGGGGSSMGGSGGMESDATTMIIVRWHTALPIKQAAARAQFGDEAATSPKAVQMLSRKETQYVVGLVGLPAQVLRAKAQLKDKAFLKPKGKDPIAAVDVQAAPEGRTASVYFFFPRAAGEQPLITLDDQEVEVAVKFPAFEVKRKFKLKEMMFDGKLEM